MKTKVRLVTIILLGVLIGVVAVQIQRNSVPLDLRLVSNDDGTRAHALRSFVKLDNEKKAPIIDKLIKGHLRSPEARERQFSLYALRKSGDTSERVLRAMINKLGDRDGKVRIEAKTGLMEAGDAALPILVEAVGNFGGRDEAMDILARGSPHVITPLARGLGDNNIVRARGSANVLGRLAVEETRVAAKPILPELYQAMRSTDTILQTNAAFAIHHIDPLDTHPIPIFLAAVRADDWSKTRGWPALKALTETPRAYAESSAVLTRMLVKTEDGFDQNQRFRRPAIANALETTAPRGRKVSDLAWDLKNKEDAIRYRALIVVGSSPTAALAGDVAGVLSDPDPINAGRAAWTLGRIGPQEIARLGAGIYPKLFAVMARVDDKTIKNFRPAVGFAIGQVGQPLLPPLVDAIKKGQLSLENADLILRSAPQDTTPYLLALMNDRNADARLASAIALARLSPKSPGVLEELTKNQNRPGAIGEDVRRAIDQINGRDQKPQPGPGQRGKRGPNQGGKNGKGGRQGGKNGGGKWNGKRGPGKGGGQGQGQGRGKGGNRGGKRGPGNGQGNNPPPVQ